jgi:hypothetical protein
VISDDQTMVFLSGPAAYRGGFDVHCKAECDYIIGSRGRPASCSSRCRSRGRGRETGDRHSAADARSGSGSQTGSEGQSAATLRRCASNARLQLEGSVCRV